MMDARKGKWAGGDACNQDVECLAEFSPEPRTPRLVPLPHFKRFVLSLGPEDDFERHNQSRSLERTSDQGTAESGLSRCSAQRLSSSARSASDSSNSPSRSASVRLSHRAIASSARSPAGSLRSSIKGLEGMNRSSHGQPVACNSDNPLARLSQVRFRLYWIRVVQRSNSSWSRPLQSARSHRRRRSDRAGS